MVPSRRLRVCRKGHDVLVRALGAVQVPLGRRIVWIFAGEGPERGALEKTSSVLPDSAVVRLPGEIEDVGMLLSAADVFCMPSRSEGLGVALLEAMAAGVPSIASRVGGMAESLVSGETGLLVPVGDADELARAIEFLIGDPVRARRLADAGQCRAAECFDVHLMGEQTTRLYRLVAGLDGLARA